MGSVLTEDLVVSVEEGEGERGTGDSGGERVGDVEYLQDYIGDIGEVIVAFGLY